MTFTDHKTLAVTMHAKDDAFQLSKEYGDAIDAARNYQNPDLTAQGLEKKRAELLAKARSEYSARAQQQRASIDRAVETMNKAVAKARPAVNKTSAAAIALAGAKWSQVRELLDAGISLGKIISTADEDTLTAIGEYGPTYLTAQAARTSEGGEDRVELRSFMNSLDARAVELGGETDTIEYYREAVAHQAYAHTVYDRIAEDASGQRDHDGPGLNLSAALMARASQDKAEYEATQALA